MGCAQSGRRRCSMAKAETAESYYRRLHKTFKQIRLKKSAVKRRNEFVRKLPELARCSSFSDEGCTHCQHFHFLQCCMQPCESISEAMGYAEWKIHFDGKRTKKEKRIKVKGIPDALAGQFTPKGFPGFTEKNLALTYVGRSVKTRSSRKKSSKFLEILMKWNLIRTSYSNKLAMMMEQEIMDFESYFG